MANNSPASKLFIEINKLLEEISTFLSDEKNVSNSTNARSQASTIIQKVKRQSKILTEMKEFPAEGESYVEMKGQSTPANMYVEFENPKDDIYCDISENTKVEENITRETVNFKEICPYSSKKYSDFTNCRKKGVLSKREKLLFFDTNRKYYGLIYEHYFLLYTSESDGQATHALNLQEFQGRAVDENPKSFFLISRITKTPYIFFAVSLKDKLQWLAAINCKKATQSPNEINRFSNNSVHIPLHVKSDYRTDESREPDDIYELLEEEEYDRVANSHTKLSGRNVKASKPLPKLPDVPSPPLRPKAIQTIPTIIRPTSSSDVDDDQEEAKSAQSIDSEEELYDTVCTTRPPINRITLSGKSRSADIASVHPSVVSDLNRLFTKQVHLPPLLKENTSSPKPGQNTRCSSDEYYDSVLGLRGVSSETKENVRASEEDIYDSVVNVKPSQTKSFQPQTINELKSRLKMVNPRNEAIMPIEYDLNIPVIPTEVKVEKRKSGRKMFSFL